MGLARGWRPALTGAAAALVALALIVAILGPLMSVVPIHALQFVVGVLLLMFGLRWLRKAILRAIGIIALHDEDAAFERETRELSEAGRREAHGFDWIGGVTAFKIVLMEGIEVVFIVIAVGAGRGLLGLASAGALAACVVVAAIGAAVHRPLARVPENALKFAVGVMLSAFGLFWTGEKSRRRVAGRRRGDPRLYRPVPGRRFRPGRASQAESSRARMIGAIVKELIGLFVDDGLLAATILCAIAFIGALALSGIAPGWLVGLMLALACRRRWRRAYCAARTGRPGANKRRAARAPRLRGGDPRVGEGSSGASEGAGGFHRPGESFGKRLNDMVR